MNFYHTTGIVVSRLGSVASLANNARIYAVWANLSTGIRLGDLPSRRDLKKGNNGTQQVVR
ncbi:MAG: hypothetical protein H7839_14255, partial [Magnetococcus sp. YQC-5]